MSFHNRISEKTGSMSIRTVAKRKAAATWYCQDIAPEHYYSVLPRSKLGVNERFR